MREHINKRGHPAQEVAIPAPKPSRPPTQFDKGFADRLALAMTVRRFRPSDLAVKTPVHRTTVSAWRRGVRPLPAVMGRVAQLLDVPLLWLDTGAGASPFATAGVRAQSATAKPSGVREPRSPYPEAEGDPAEGPGWLWEDPTEAEERFRDQLRYIERSIRGMVGDPEAVQQQLKELRLVVIDMSRSGARAAGRPIPPFVQVVENEIIAGTFR